MRNNGSDDTSSAWMSTGFPPDAITLFRYLISAGVAASARAPVACSTLLHRRIGKRVRACRRARIIP
ncbi:hypothetical protein [Reyranella sp.]|uniref:hypothetical protein n=1 Tax=Reyranella sp. TaxID=1929291 RepID=UPI0040371A79